MTQIDFFIYIGNTQATSRKAEKNSCQGTRQRSKRMASLQETSDLDERGQSGPAATLSVWLRTPLGFS